MSGRRTSPRAHIACPNCKTSVRTWTNAPLSDHALITAYCPRCQFRFLVQVRTFPSDEKVRNSPPADLLLNKGRVNRLDKLNSRRGDRPRLHPAGKGGA